MKLLYRPTPLPPSLKLWRDEPAPLPPSARQARGE